MTEQDNKLLAEWSKQDILDYYKKEKKRALYHIEKQIPTNNHRDKIREIMRQYSRARMCFDTYEYQGEAFKWIGCIAATYHIDCVFRCDTVCALTYGEGDDMGIIAVDEDEDEVIILSSGMAQRVKDYYEGNHVKQLLLPLLAGVHMGVKRTGISDDGISIEEYAFRCHRPEEGLIVCDEKIPIQVFRDEHKDLVDMQGWFPLPNLFRPEYVLDSEFPFFTQLYMLLGDCVNNFIDWSKTDFDSFVGRALTRIAGSTAVNKSLNCKTFENTLIEEATKVLWHYKHDCTKEEVAQILPNLSYYKYVKNYNHKFETYNTMDKKLTETLRKTLKNYGLRDKHENLIKAARTTVEAWYNWAEPLYAISRLIPYITNEKDKPKFLQADKDWVEYLVNNDKCSALDEFVKTHGKQVVIQAIHYLMDNGIWEAPIGVKDIRKVTPETYNGTKAIAEAIEYLRSENMLHEEEPQESVPTPEPKPSAPVPTEPKESATGTLSNAQEAYLECQDLFEQVKDKFATMEKYFEQDELSKLLEEDNVKLGYDNKKLAKDNERLTDSIKIVNQQLNEQKKETKKQQEIAYKAVQDKNKALDDFTKLKAQYEQEHEELINLRAEAKKTTTATKVIKASELRQIPLIGQGVLHGLIPFLKKKNITVNENC